MREHNYDDKKLEEAIGELESERINCKKDLELLKIKFNKLKDIERTEDNKEDYDKALENLNKLKNKINKKLEDVNIKLLEHRIVEKNRKINLNKNINKSL